MQKFKLLISVSNYCDPEYEMTIKSLWDNSGMKDHIFFSLVSEDKIIYNFSFIPNDQILYRHFELADTDPIYRGGVCWSRNLALDVPIDYEYFIQLDSHTLATKDWDLKALSVYENANADYEKVIISGQPADYDYYPDGTLNFYKFPTSTTYVKDLEGLYPGLSFPKHYTVPLGEFKESAWVVGGYIFAPKLWVEEVGINKDWSFNTEEFMMTVKSFDKGWKVMTYGQRHLFHHSSHRMPDGTVTRDRFRPWSDSRADAYWKHVNTQTDKLSEFLSNPMNEVSYAGLYNFYDKTKLDKKFMTYIPDYHNFINLPHRHLGMPPRSKF